VVLKKLLHNAPHVVTFKLRLHELMDLSTDTGL